MARKYAALLVVAALLLTATGCSALRALTGGPKPASKAEAQQLFLSLEQELDSVLDVLGRLDDVEDQDLIP